MFCVITIILQGYFGNEVRFEKDRVQYDPNTNTCFTSQGTFCALRESLERPIYEKGLEELREEIQELKKWILDGNKQGRILQINHAGNEWEALKQSGSN